MNTGLLFGEVFYGSGGPVEKARVVIDWVKGDLSQSGIKIQLTEKENENAWVATDTDEDGKYVLPFFWDGTEIAKTLQTKTMTMRTFAFTNNDTDRMRVKAHLCMDLKKLFSVAFPTFDNPTQEAFDCAKDFMLAFRQVKTFPPHHKVLLSTEIWGILAKANFVLSS